MTVLNTAYLQIADQLHIRKWDRACGYVARRWPVEPLPSSWFLLGQNEDPRDRQSWAVLYDGSVVGRMTLRDFHYDAARQWSARLGTYFAPHVRGLGIGRPAYKLFLSTVPLLLDLRIIYGDIHVDNKIAYNLSIKSGFKPFATEIRWSNNEPHVYSLVRYEVKYEKSSF